MSRNKHIISAPLYIDGAEIAAPAKPWAKVLGALRPRHTKHTPARPCSPPPPPRNISADRGRKGIERVCLSKAIVIFRLRIQARVDGLAETEYSVAPVEPLPLQRKTPDTISLDRPS